MKNIILIILTFFTLSLFGQTEQPDEFRAPTGVIKSIKGTNFKKSIKVIGGKNVTVYEQPNTDTYNTFSIVNDSVRIQKWKLDTATNVFVTSNLNDVYLDNLVNKPSVDSRVVLDVVNDSLKVEVWDIINNTLLSTYYIDNVGNHPETITTITDTLVGAHLIANYNNEANVVRGIYESIIQVDSITNGYVITKEDGLKDTIKLNATGFYTLTSLDDTLALTTIAASKCPALTIAKLDSCNVAYLFMFNCGTGSWELFKTPNIYTAGKTLFVDEITGTDNGKKGCPTCAFKEPYGAFRSATEYIDGNTVKVEAGNYSLGFIGDGTSKEVPSGPYGLSTNNYSTGIDTFRLHLEQGANIKFTQSRGIGTPHPAWVGWSTQPKFIGISGYGTFNATNGTLFHHAVADGTFYMNLDKIETGYSVGEFMNKESVFNIGSIIQNNNTGGGLFFGPSLNSKTTKPKYSATIKNWTISDNRINLYNISAIVNQSAAWGEVSDGLQNCETSVSIDNLLMNTNEFGLYALVKYATQFDSNNTSIKVKNFNFKRVQSAVPFTLGSLFEIGKSNSIFKSDLKPQSITPVSNSNIRIELDNVVGDGLHITTQSNTTGSQSYVNSKIEISLNKAILKNAVGLNFAFTNFDNCTIYLVGDIEVDYPAIYLVNCTFNNSKIIFKGNFKNTTANPLFYFNNCTFTNSKFIADGNFSTPDKILMVTGGSFDATSVIELQGTFKTTSTTLPAIDINNSRLFLKDCDIITGGGYSIDSATPVNVTVKPGCASNVTTSANVTQLGTGIYVDPNFNN